MSFLYSLSIITLTLVSFRFHGKTNGSAHIGCTAHMNALSMCFNNVFANGETQTGAAFIAAAGSIGAVKAFKNAGQVFFFNTYAIVTDLNQYMLIVGIDKYWLQ